MFPFGGTQPLPEPTLRLDDGGHTQPYTLDQQTQHTLEGVIAFIRRIHAESEMKTQELTECRIELNDCKKECEALKKQVEDLKADLALFNSIKAQIAGATSIVPVTPDPKKRVRH